MVTERLQGGDNGLTSAGGRGGGSDAGGDTPGGRGGGLRKLSSILKAGVGEILNVEREVVRESFCVLCVCVRGGEGVSK